MKKLQIGMLGLLACVAGGVQAKTNYVNCALGSYAGHDGSTPELAFETIQDGVDASVNGDIVWVARGHYAKGGMVQPNGAGFNRVYMGVNGVTVKSAEGKDVTFIEGARDPSPVDDYGNGPNAVRCVFAHADKCIIEGFTLAGGAAHPTKLNEDNANANGGGLRGLTTGSLSCLVDCTVTNCTGVRGAAVYYGRAVRTLFVGNVAAWKAAGGNNSRFLQCVFTRNSARGGGGLLVSGVAINCTIYNNWTSYVGTESAQFKNCVAVRNFSVGDAATGQQLKAYSCVFDGGATSAGKPYFSTAENSVTNATPFQLMNPLFDDFRLPSDSVAVGRGTREYIEKTTIDLPAKVARNLDFAGNVIPEEGPFHAGALQVVAEPKGGILQFPTAIDGAFVSADGHAAKLVGAYVRASDVYPTQFLVRALPPTGYAFYGYKRFGKGMPDGKYVFPLADDSLYMLPPVKGLVYTNTIYAAAANHTFYVNPTGDDTNNDGLSAAKPFKTIQKAVNSAGSSYTVIKCAAGDYDSDDNVTRVGTVTNRVYIGATVSVRIVGAGRGETVIWGGKSSFEGYQGCGPGAIRCVYGNTTSGSAIQNLTLRGGRLTYTGTDADDNNDMKGAGVLMYQAGLQILDCEIDDCIGYRGAVYGGSCYRTTITRSYGYNGGVRYSSLYACVLTNNLTGSQQMLSYNLPKCSHVTVVGQSTSDSSVIVDIPCQNSIIDTLNATASTWKSDWSGTYVGNCAWRGYGLGDGHLVDAAAGDLRLLSTSPAIGGGAWTDDYPLTYTPDIEGRPIEFVNGRPTAGAVQREHVQGLVVNGNGANGVIFSNAGTNAIAAGESVTVTYDETRATRPVCGFLVNGQYVDFPETPTWTFTAPAVGEAVTQGFSLEPVFTNVWYVNANATDNSGNGFRPETAKRSFHEENGVFATGFVKEQDVVKALPGTYDRGTATFQSLGTRVVVPAYVTLVATGSPEETIIQGAAATDSSADAYGRGRGEDAVRCVGLPAYATLRGFTVTGGATPFNDSTPGYGGGINCTAGDSSKVYDCIISNNAATRGGGMHNGFAINCRFFDNWASANRSAKSQGLATGCIFDHNRGLNTTQNLEGMWNCTFGLDNTLQDGTTATQASGMNYGPIVNCLFTGTFECYSSADAFVTNCVLAKGLSGSEKRVEFVDCITTNLADVVFEEGTYAPIIGQTPGIDAGYADENRIAEAGGVDARGGQRVYNGRIDVGAVEADWRATYAQTFFPSGTVVNEATPDVTLAADGPSLNIASGKVTATIPGAGTQPATYEVPLEITGTGDLVYSFNATSETFDFDSGAVKPKRKSYLEQNEVSFVYTPGKDDTGFAQIGALTRTTHGLIFLIK